MHINFSYHLLLSLRYFFHHLLMLVFDCFFAFLAEDRSSDVTFNRLTVY
jgi:hypothetical protein